MTPRPMLALSIEPSDVEQYLRNDDYLAQRKLDGHRLLVVVEDGKVSALGRSGQAKVTGLSQDLFKQFSVFDQGNWVFDAELVGSQLVLFDMVTAGGQIPDNAAFPLRYQVLQTLYDIWQPDLNLIGLLPVAQTEAEKRTLWQEAQDNGWEGIILRHRLGQYRGGSRSPHLLKCKFVKTVDAIVVEVGVDGHNNVVLALLDPEREQVLKIGRASAIGKRSSFGGPPRPGEIWEVQYLYVLDKDNPRLYQPRLRQDRPDKELSECVLSQLEGCYTDKSFTEKTRTGL